MGVAPLERRRSDGDRPSEAMTMSENRTPALTGGCQCGAVRYALYAVPPEPSICHCRMCVTS